MDRAGYYRKVIAIIHLKQHYDGKQSLITLAKK